MSTDTHHGRVRRSRRVSPRERVGIRAFGSASRVPADTPRRLASIGMRKRATSRAASREMTTASPRSPNACPATPWTKTMGRKTAMEVKVEATTAIRTSAVPRRAAVRRSSPSSRHREMDSSTTMDESTSMPMPRARPPRDMMLSETPSTFSGAKVTSRETGMLTAMITVGRTRLRKRKSTRTANSPP